MRLPVGWLCNQQCSQFGVHCNSGPRCLQVNVHSKRCQEALCSKHASFGYSAGRPQFCADHRAAGMVRYKCACLPLPLTCATALCGLQCFSA